MGSVTETINIPFLVVRSWMAYLQNMWLVACAALQTLKECSIIVLLQRILVVRMGTLLDDEGGTFARRESTEISEALLRNDDIKIVLGMINVRGEGNNARDSSGISLRGAAR